MALMRYRHRNRWPLGELKLWDEWDRLFDFPTTLIPFRRLGTIETMSPAVELYEEGDNLVLKAELPGLNKDEIEITMDDSVLTIKGEKKEETEKKGKEYYRMERVYGKFFRTIELPETIDSEKIKGTYKNGVLEVTLPKKEEAKPKEIKVEVK